VLIEKPFGTDLDSARSLNMELTEVFSESQIYRIDHFLGKETVQNVLAFRFANGLFEELWNKKFIDHIQVTFSESIGIAGRGQFYDATGATRDVLQNHLLQMIAVTLMEEPKSLDSEDIRHSRSQLLEAIAFPEGPIEHNLAFGQYIAGKVDGQPVVSFLDEHNIPSNSATETAIALKLEVHTERWQGVPIYVRTGKRLATDVLEISVQFKDPQNQMFKEIKYGPDPNILTFRFQPNEGIILRLFVKKPGHGIELDLVPMEFNYHNQYQMDLIEAYERLIHDASVGDPTLFPSADSIEATWRIIDAILDKKPNEKPDEYIAGSWGPSSFDDIIQRDNRKWIEPTIEKKRRTEE
jgi:glucose-6-phosphate 1-dehydrogenase